MFHRALISGCLLCVASGLNSGDSAIANLEKQVESMKADQAPASKIHKKQHLLKKDEKQASDSSQGSNYQQYMTNYQQYMNKYAGGSQGGSQSQSGDYQQYMKKYAGGNSGDYQQYMKKYAGGSQGGSQSQSGDYQQYMKKYAGGSQGGDYQQYMKKYAGGSQGGSQSQSGDYQHYYQQYMKKYAGGAQGGAQGSAATTELLEQSADKDSGSSAGSGDYQQYMKKYAGGSQGGSQSQSGDYQHYYKQYMSKYAGGSQGGAQSGDYQQYMKKYAGGSQGGDYQQYMKKYAGGHDNYQQYMDYQQYMKKHGEFSNAIGSAHDAQNKSQLDAWRDQSRDTVSMYVPTDYSEYADHSIDSQYKERLYELDHPASKNTADDSEAKASLNLDATPEHRVQQNLTASKRRLRALVDEDQETGENETMLATKSSPSTIAFFGLLGVAFACIVFFAKRSPRVQLPTAPLLG